MKLTDADLKMINWLRRQHAGWRSTRVITAVGSSVAVGWAVLSWLQGESTAGVAPLAGMGFFGLSYSVGAGRAVLRFLFCSSSSSTSKRATTREYKRPSNSRLPRLLRELTASN